MLVSTVRSRVPVAERNFHFFRFDVREKTGCQEIPEAFTHRSAFFFGSEAGNLIILNSMPVLMENDLGIFRVIDSAGTERQILLGGTVVRVVITLSIDIDRNRVIEQVLEAELLKVPLNSIDMKIDHHFLECTIGTFESKIEVRSLHPLRGCFRGDEGTFEEASLLKIA